MWTPPGLGASERGCPHEPLRSPACPLIQLIPSIIPYPTGVRRPALGAKVRSSIDFAAKRRGEGAERSAYWARESRQLATGNTDQKGIPFFLPHLIQNSVRL